MPRKLVAHSSGCVYKNVSGDDWHVAKETEKTHPIGPKRPESPERPERGSNRPEVQMEQKDGRRRKLIHWMISLPLNLWNTLFKILKEGE